jgi:hypothetical protein
VLDTPVTAVEVSPSLWNVWTQWRTGVIGLLLPGTRDEVTEAFNQALKRQYVEELHLWAKHIIVDKQPPGGPRM